jgi:hypothetical protein
MLNERIGYLASSDNTHLNAGLWQSLTKLRQIDRFGVGVFLQ